MTCLADYVVAIPSKGRARNMPRMLSSFPEAHVYVDIKEEKDYAPVVPKDQLFFHDSLPDQWHIWEHILQEEKAECVLLLDDDFEFVGSFVKTYPKYRRYTKAADLKRIVENGVNILCDLDLPLYGWSSMAHPGGFNPTAPISLTGNLTSALLIRGRKYRLDLYTLCCDLDLVLQVLLRDRLLIKDMRWYWCFGITGGNEGGCQSTDSMEVIHESRRRMVAKWGDYLCIGKLPLTSRMLSNTQGTVEHFGHNVNRRSSVIHK
jgi:hypothetical protein